MNNIIKRPIKEIGYGFIDPAYLPNGKDEYHLRDQQNKNGIHYRNLTASEIEALVKNDNSSDNWNNIFVSDAFNPGLVKKCTFFGLVRIGELDPVFLEFKNLRLPVGLYNSTIISCDIGDNVVIDNVNYLSHYIIGSEVIITNVNELATTNVAKFGNGVVKEGEPEDIRIQLEVCNENGGRAIIPFNGMLPGDAFMWAKYRKDEKLLHKFMEFTEKKFDKQRGYYGKIGDRCVIKNCRMIKDVWMGSDVYMKGANKIKNLTINSNAEAKTQIGEGCELVNGIIGEGCKVFYGVKAVRFIMASHSQLKYGARLINSYLGNNSTISCCEVLNSLIFPFHEQHHNNSFLCASLLGGQSNMAAAATVGSNHNSRAADGEIIAGRGFWPGLSVSLKHNSRFASFTILSKGAYPAEMDIRIPFSLISDDVAHNRLIIVPGYWFNYNLYALTRNEWKYKARDLRTEKKQFIETSFLAPDSVNDMFQGLKWMQQFTGKAWFEKFAHSLPDETACILKGKELLDNNNPIVDELDVYAEGFENSNRKVLISKIRTGYQSMVRMIRFYGIQHLIQFPEQVKIIGSIPKDVRRTNWINAGGQLIPETEVNQFREDVKTDKINSWGAVHQFYKQQEEKYSAQIREHALASLLEIAEVKSLNKEMIGELLTEGKETSQWIMDGIYQSRLKDYHNPYRQMVYEDEEEMNKVIGDIEQNVFILSKKEESKQFTDNVNRLLKELT